MLYRNNSIKLTYTGKNDNDGISNFTKYCFVIARLATMAAVASS